jgi:Rrf2 family protein
MRLSTRVRYGVRAMVELALQAGDPSVSSREVGARQKISPKYVGQLLAQLRASGLVRSVRGQGGGFQLARPPEKVTLLDVVQAFEGSLAPVPCVDDPAVCPRSNRCATRDLWCELKESLEKPLRRTTLADLARRQRRKAGAQPPRPGTRSRP